MAVVLLLVRCVWVALLAAATERAVAHIPGAIDAVLAVMVEHTADARVQEAGAGVLQSLACDGTHDTVACRVACRGRGANAGELAQPTIVPQSAPPTPSRALRPLSAVTVWSLCYKLVAAPCGTWLLRMVCAWAGARFQRVRST